jgi:hypothetical protein
MINVNQITSQLAKMPDHALQQYAAMHKSDPYTVALALAESNRRKELRAGAQMNVGQQPTVVDQEVAGMAASALPEDQGIGQLPAENIKGMAGGGIVAFEEGGEVDRYQNKGVTESKDGPEQYRAYALKRAQELGLDPIWVDRIFGHESKTKRSPMGYDPEAVSPTGATGIGQLVKNTANHYMRKVGHIGLKDEFDPEIRKDPYKNIDASLAYMSDLKQKYKGDPRLMAVGYNQGESYLDKHLKENEGKLNPEALKSEPKNYLQQTVEKMIPSAEAATKEPPKFGPNAPGAAPGAASNALPVQAPWYDRYRKLMTSGEGQQALLQGVQDVPAALLGAPVDLTTMAMRPFGYKNEAPMMGSKWLKEKFTDLGVRAPESANPDLQTLRSGAEGVATLYNPFDKVSKATKLSKEGIAALGAENKATAIEGARANAEMSGAMSAEAKLAADAEAARRAQLAAEGPSKAAAIQNANELAAARAAPVGKSLNPIGEASMLANADMSMDPTAAAAIAQTNPAAGPSIDGDAVKALRDKLGGGGASETPAAGGLAGLFKDPAFLMGMRLMGSQNPRLLGAVGEAGIGTAGDLAAAAKAEADAAAKKGEARYYSAYADAMERGAKEKNMSLEAEKLVQQHMEKWGASPVGQLAGLKDASAAQAEEARVRNAIYQQLGISPTMGAAPAPSTSGFKLLGVR